MRVKINRQALRQLADTTLPDVLSVREVEHILGVGRVSVYRLIKEGKISAFQMGNTYKIPKQTLTQFLETWEDDRK